MKCSDLQLNLALFADSDALAGHLAVCPLCRQKNTEYREIHAGLRQMRRPEISATLRNTIKDAVRSEIRVEKYAWLPISSGVRGWLQMQVMPYSVGVAASLLIGMTFLTMMFSGMLNPGNVPITLASKEQSIMLASNSNPFKNTDSAMISPPEYAKSRLEFASESPSINPQGALIALTRSLVRGGMKDDEVVVVADVFSNGLARITEVVEPSHNRKAVGELEKALESDADYAPFVPTSMETRPDSVRVILKFQSVNVSTGAKSQTQLRKRGKRH